MPECASNFGIQDLKNCLTWKSKNLYYCTEKRALFKYMTFNP